MYKGGDRRVYGRCSFCGKGEDQVGKLIAGPGVFICDQCVEMCHEGLKSDNRPDQERSGGFGLTAHEVELANLYAHGFSLDAMGLCLALNPRMLDVSLRHASSKMSATANVLPTLPSRREVVGWLSRRGLLSRPSDSQALLTRAIAALENLPRLPGDLLREERRRIKKDQAKQMAVLLEAQRALQKTDSPSEV